MAAQILTPLIVPAVPETVYSEIWIRRFNVEAPDCNGGPATLNATFVLVSRDENGFGIFSDEFSQTLVIPDIFATAGTNAQFDALMTDVMGMLIELAVQDGLFAVVTESPSESVSESI